MIYLFLPNGFHVESLVWVLSLLHSSNNGLVMVKLIEFLISVYERAGLALVVFAYNSNSASTSEISRRDSVSRISGRGFLALKIVEVIKHEVEIFLMVGS